MTSRPQALYSQAVSILSSATSLDRSGNYQTAVNRYRDVLQTCQNIKICDRYGEFSKQCAELCSKVQGRIDELTGCGITTSTSVSKPGNVSASSLATSQKPKPQQESKKSQDKKPEEVSISEQVIVTEKPCLTFNDVAGLESAKQSLKEAVILPLKLPHLFDEKVRPWKGILLYGPPGTGKSYLAKALAGEARDMTFIAVSVADVTSKWVGESEKLVRSLFETARQKRPAIIFIDEIDSLVKQRDDKSSEASASLKTELLVQMDGMNVDNSGVLVIGATNIPWSIDMAVRRRFEKRIYIPLPDAATRKELITHSLKGSTCKISERTINKIVEKTDGFSGADLAILIRDALMEGMREITRSEYFKRGVALDKEGKERDDLWVVCGKEDAGAVQTTWDKLNPDEVGKPYIVSRHFASVMKRVKPSVAKKDLEQYARWTAEFGEDGK